MDDALQLEALVRQVEAEFSGAVETRRIPLIDGSGYVVRFDPRNERAASVTIDYSAGIYTIDVGGLATFDGYDSPEKNGEIWAMNIVRKVANEGFEVEQTGVMGLRRGVRISFRSDEKPRRGHERPRKVDFVVEPWVVGRSTPGD